MGPMMDRPSPVLRDVPVWLRLQALFGGVANFLGWAFLGMGMLAFWLGVMHCEAVTFWKYLGRLETTTGTVTRTFDTNASEGGSKHSRGTPIYGIDYTYTPPGAASSLTGTSYQLGDAPSDGTTVTVEYRPDHPDYSRIRGLRSAVFGPELLFVLIFPGIGLAFVIYGMRKGLHANALLARGVPAVGTLVSVEETNVKENKRRVYKMTFAFTAADGTRATATLSSANPEPAWMRLYEQDNRAEGIPPEELRETVLYHPGNPAAAFIPAQFGWRIRVDAGGNVQGSNPLAGFASLILPLLVVAGNVWYVLTQLGR